jgi:hypothetical protein
MRRINSILLISWLPIVIPLFSVGLGRLLVLLVFSPMLNAGLFVADQASFTFGGYLNLLPTRALGQFWTQVFSGKVSG